MIGYFGMATGQLDDKYRFRIPSKFSPKNADGSEPEDKSGSFCFLAGAQGYLGFYSEQALQEHVNRIRSMEDGTRDKLDSVRKLSAAIEPAETDKQGRVVIPARFRAHAKIVKDLILIGMGDHFEIWAKDEYERHDSQVTYDKAYSEIGFF